MRQVFYTLMDDLNHRLARDLDTAFPELVSMMGTRLFSGLRRISGQHQEAEDLAQEVLIRAYRALCEYEPERIRGLKVEGWLWTIALNLGRNHVRDRRRRPTPALEVDTPHHDPEPADFAAWDRRLGALNSHQRTAVVLRHVVGLGTGEISEATGRPEGTVKNDIHRGLQRLRQIMEEEE
jgi:RNA polymerase sigma factor (sigma-70 family)